MTQLVRATLRTSWPVSKAEFTEPWLPEISEIIYYILILFLIMIVISGLKGEIPLENVKKLVLLFGEIKEIFLDEGMKSVIRVSFVYEEDEKEALFNLDGFDWLGSCLKVKRESTKV